MIDGVPAILPQHLLAHTHTPKTRFEREGTEQRCEYYNRWDYIPCIASSFIHAYLILPDFVYTKLR